MGTVATNQSVRQGNRVRRFGSTSVGSGGQATATTGRPDAFTASGTKDAGIYSPKLFVAKAGASLAVKAATTGKVDFSNFTKIAKSLATAGITGATMGMASGKSSPKEGTGTGVLGPRDPHAAVAAKRSAKIANKKVDWKNPGAALGQMSQFDGKLDQGGTDPVRCGAAVIIAGGVLKGPEKFQEGISNVLNRASDLGVKLEAGVAGARGGPQRLFTSMNKDVNKAMDILEKYEQKDPKSYTYGDMSKMQDALYLIAKADQRLGGNNRQVDPNENKHQYLLTDSVGEYSKLMWGSGAPKQDGKSVSIYRIDNQQGGGHYVLGDRRGSVTYNPWPDQDGSAFSSSVDGRGPSIVNGKPQGGSQLQGAPVADYPNTLPSRN